MHFRHLWGRETSHEELMALGARVWNLGRLINLREGFTRGDDRLPEILSVPHPGGTAAGKAIGDEEFRAALDEYYALRGWRRGRRAERGNARAALGGRANLGRRRGEGRE